MPGSHGYSVIATVAPREESRNHSRINAVIHREPRISSGNAFGASCREVRNTGTDTCQALSPSKRPGWKGRALSYPSFRDYLTASLHFSRMMRNFVEHVILLRRSGTRSATVCRRASFVVRSQLQYTFRDSEAKVSAFRNSMSPNNAHPHCTSIKTIYSSNEEYAIFYA